MRVLLATAECFPFIKTGGLADVTGALPKALASCGAEPSVLLPNYGALTLNRDHFDTTYTWDDLFGGNAQLLSGDAEGLRLNLLDAPHLFARDGNPYVQADGSDWPDNAQRFAALSKAAVDIGVYGVQGWQPDVIHANDWHTGLIPLFLRLAHEDGNDAPPCVFTIHNIIYQGTFPLSARDNLGLPTSGPLANATEQFGELNYMKTGLTLADKINAVSPTYASELLTPEFGAGLDGLLRDRRSDVTGILNGIDTETWDPATDETISYPYSASKPAARAKNKRALEEVFGLPHRPDQPLLGVISRLTAQKGLDVVIDALPAIRGLGARLAVIGTGDPALEQAYRDAADTFPEDVAVKITYDEALAHQMQAGADAILVPSRFEPCGLTQLCGLRYGCIPVVSRVGGLSDTVIDANPAALAADTGTGIQFSPVTTDGIIHAVDRLMALYRDKPIWRKLVRRAMRQPVGWDRSAETYLSLYRFMVAEAA